MRLPEASLCGFIFLDAGAAIASMPFLLKGDNISTQERMDNSDNKINRLLEAGDIEGVQSWVKEWNDDPKHEGNRIIFRYMSSGEFIGRSSGLGKFGAVLPIDRNGVKSLKYITPDFLFKK